MAALLLLVDDDVAYRALAVDVLRDIGVEEVVAVLGLTVSMENWMAVGKAAVDWLVARPEIDPGKVDKSKGMNITIVTTAPNDEQARFLLRELGMPFGK